MSRYTSEMVAELHGLESPVTRPVVDAFADKYSLTVKSVVAKLRHLGIEYQPPESVERPQARKKIEIARSIEAMLDFPQDSLAGLDKATVQTLQKIENVLFREFVEPYIEAEAEAEAGGGDS